MTDAPPSLAVQRRRASQRQEWAEQTRLAEMLDEYLDPADTFWTSLENKPLSRLSGIFQKQRGVRSGLPDVEVIWRGKPIFVELKSRAGVASKAQKQIRAKLKPAGADWWLARSARAALMALHLPDVAARRRAARRRWQVRQRRHETSRRALGPRHGDRRRARAGSNEPWPASLAASSAE
jgi:hypothetical protein